jgi:hypothetical protein
VTWFVAAALLAGAACGFVIGFWTCAMMIDN